LRIDSTFKAELEKVHKLKGAKLAFFTKVHEKKLIIKAPTSKLLGISYI
jgi:hypothetical protein